MNKKLTWNSFSESILSNKIFTIVVIIYLLIAYLGTFLDSMDTIIEFTKNTIIRVSPNQLTDHQLVNQSSQTAKELINFIHKRQEQEPAFNNTNWDKSVAEQTIYSSETKALFFKDFYPKISLYIREFKKRNMNITGLEQESNHATNPLVLQSIARRLFDLANKLKLNME